MILIFCPPCKDVISLADREMRYCKCKKSGGMYINSTVVEIEGKAVPLELDIGHIQLGILKRRADVPFSFGAFIIPDGDPHVTRQKLCYRCRNDQTDQLEVMQHPENSKDNQEDSQGYQIYRCRICGEYHGCRYQYNQGSGSDSRWAMLGKDPAKVKRHY
jgi:hypothetical protein